MRGNSKKLKKWVRQQVKKETPESIKPVHLLRCQNHKDVDISWAASGYSSAQAFISSFGLYNLSCFYKAALVT